MTKHCFVQLGSETSLLVADKLVSWATMKTPKSKAHN